MFNQLFNKSSKEWRQFITWVAATLVFPFVAYVCVKDTTPDLQFSVPVILILSFCWGLVSFFMYKFIKGHVT